MKPEVSDSKIKLSHGLILFQREWTNFLSTFSYSISNKGYAPVLKPCRHTTSFQRRYDVHNVIRRRINIERTSCVYREVAYDCKISSTNMLSKFG